jgi:hypothetical protein
MLLVYTEKGGPRLNYIFSLILKEMLGLDFSFTHNKEEFIHYTGPKFNYSSSSLSDELLFKNVNLLVESDVRVQPIQTFTSEDHIAFFKVTHSALDFDIFAAAFYLVSRYEEYLPHTKDKHGRFPAEQSLAYKEKFLSTPVVNIWVQRFKKIIQQKFPELIFKEQSFQFIPTIDIDQAFAIKNKSFPRIIASFFKSWNDLQEIKWKWKIISGKEKDPFDQYEKFEKLHRKYELRPIFFFLLGKFNPRTDDINLNPSNPVFKEVIRSITASADVGIHPSYASNSITERIIEERQLLENIISSVVTKSRQHYLRMQIPGTYRSLIDSGITEDHTMGYASQVGFRAGICTSFYFFDLGKNENTRLRIFPFCVMDATLKSYLKADAPQSFVLIERLYNEVKKVNGTFISLWHNESMSDYKEWKGWGDLYEKILQLNTKKV